MVPNTGPVCILFPVWVCRNDGKEDVKDVSCIDPDTEEENLTGSSSLGKTLQYDVHVFELLLHVLYDVICHHISYKVCVVFMVTSLDTNITSTKLN
jgi:hypothetical protein